MVSRIEQVTQEGFYAPGSRQRAKELIGHIVKPGFDVVQQFGNHLIPVPEVVSDHWALNAGFIGDAFQGRSVQSEPSRTSYKGVENFLTSGVFEAGTWHRSGP